MIPKKYEFVTFAFFMSLFMTILMSFVVTFVNVGFIDGFFVMWGNAFMRAYVVAFPAVLTVVPLVRKPVKKLVSPT